MSKTTAISPTVEKVFDESGRQSVDPQVTRRKPWWKFGGTDYGFVTVNDGYDTASSTYESKNNSTESLGGHHNVFNNAESKEIYKPIKKYEGRHRFDPSYKWEPEEEKKLVKTVSLSINDLYIKLMQHSLIGALPYQPASCSLPFNSTVEISLKPFRALCCVSLFLQNADKTDLEHR